VDGEIVVERRRQWTPEEKAALMAEVEAEGGQVSVVARIRTWVNYGLTISQVAEVYGVAVGVIERILREG
jgi:transposase-like protein